VQKKVLNLEEEIEEKKILSEKNKLFVFFLIYKIWVILAEKSLQQSHWLGNISSFSISSL